MSLICRLLPYSVADGPTNMAADDALLDSASAGIASLRFYGWREPTLSLGYFQPVTTARAYPGLGELAWVRRPSGGAALVHHHELTYALALPASPVWQPRGDSWLCRMHRLIREGLRSMGIEANLCNHEQKHGEVLCFRHHTPGDLFIDGHKIVGSAQRKHRGALLQHGSILLAQSLHTPQLPGIAERTGCFISSDELQCILVGICRRSFGWQIEPGEWTESERVNTSARITSRYTLAEWNEKR